MLNGIDLGHLTSEMIAIYNVCVKNIIQAFKNVFFPQSQISSNSIIYYKKEIFLI